MKSARLGKRKNRLSRNANRAALSAAARPAVEGLEARRLLTAWSPQDLAIGLDKATANFPGINGSGESVVIIDGGGIDYNHYALGSGTGSKIVYTFNYDTGSTDVFPYDNVAHPTGVAGQLAGDPHYIDGQLYQGVAPSLKIIDLKANPPVVIGTVETGRGPAGVAIGPKGNIALVANREEGTVSVYAIDGKNLTALGKVDFGNPKAGPSGVSIRTRS